MPPEDSTGKPGFRGRANLSAPSESLFDATRAKKAGLGLPVGDHVEPDDSQLVGKELQHRPQGRRGDLTIERGIAAVLVRESVEK